VQPRREFAVVGSILALVRNFASAKSFTAGVEGISSRLFLYASSFPEETSAVLQQGLGPFNFGS
jgi:hypothetical protein